MSLTSEQHERYARHLALPEIGVSGQEKLLRARVLVVGLGGLGSAAGFYLAAAGIGVLGLMDSDSVDVSNLQRQILHRAVDVGRSKVESAARALRELNPELILNLHHERLTAAVGAEFLSGYDIVVDATDNFASRFVVADLCHAAGRPYVHAGILDYSGHVLTVIPGQTACYRCIFDDAPENNHGAAAPRGPLSALPGVLGSVQAVEILKYFLGIGSLLVNRLLIFDALGMSFRNVPVNRNPCCRLCGG